MAEYCTASFIYLLFLVFLNTAAELDAYSSKMYLHVGLGNAAICNPLADKTEDFELKKIIDPAVIVSPSQSFYYWLSQHQHCKFKIEAIKGDGLFAVIQKMSLRRRGSDCLDYIQFTTESGRPGGKLCGKFDNYIKSDTSMLELPEYETSDPNSQNGIMNPLEKYEAFNSKGKITTEIFISPEPLHPREPLDLVVVYTPYKDCSKINDKKQFWSGPPYYNTCINSKFFCDGYLNCASTICSDESNCNTVRKIFSDGIGTKVTVSAVTTIFLCFIIFMLCLWICRKHKKLCWSPDCAGPSATISGSTSGLPMERNDQNSAPIPPYVSTAPMLEVAVPSSHHDKDLPPSYDSLFPAQANTANT